jgi:iron(III) transport system ATP-binding protein
MTAAVLELENLSLDVDGPGVSLTVQRGDVVALVGPSGSGKTTLLRIVLGLLAPARGVVRLRGNVVTERGRLLVPPEARGLAMVFQDLALWPHLTVHGNLAFALDARGMPAAQREERVSRALARVGLERFGARSPSSLSGGERQRVALARALVTEPDLALFDEPLANLDVALKLEMLALIRQVLAEGKTTAVYVTHDPREARELGATVAVLESGRIVQVGTLAELAADPKTAFVRTFVQAM